MKCWRPSAPPPYRKCFCYDAPTSIYVSTAPPGIVLRTTASGRVVADPGSVRLPGSAPWHRCLAWILGIGQVRLRRRLQVEGRQVSDLHPSWRQARNADDIPSVKVEARRMLLVSAFGCKCLATRFQSGTEDRIMRTHHHPPQSCSDASKYICRSRCGLPSEERRCCIQFQVIVRCDKKTWQSVQKVVER